MKVKHCLLKSVFPKEVLVTLYKTLIASYIPYGLLVLGYGLQ